MNKLSIKDSLDLLLPNSKDEIVTLEKKKKKAVRSPLKIPTLNPTEKEIQEDIIIKETVKKEEKVVKDDDEEKEEFRSPHTPTRFRIETPRRPVNKFNETTDKEHLLNLYDRLKDKRYTLLKYIVNSPNNLIYLVCFDPNGQIVFLYLENFEDKVSIEEKDIVYVERNYDDLILDAYQASIQEKMLLEVKGVVFYDGKKYLFSIHKDDGSVENIVYNIIDNKNKENLIVSETFTVVTLEELEKETTFLVDSTKENYKIIQQQQQLVSENTINNLITSTNNLLKNLKRFNNIHGKYIENLVHDWNVLSICSGDYYKKYGNGVLTSEEKDTYDKISVNMFARFQGFNKQLLFVNKLNKIIPDIDKSSNIINRITEDLDSSNLQLADKIVDIEELNISI